MEMRGFCAHVQFIIIITHSQREAYMVLVRNGGSGGSGNGRQLSQNPQAI